MTALLTETRPFAEGDEVIVEDPSFGAQPGVVTHVAADGTLGITGPQIDDVTETVWTIRADIVAAYVSHRD